MRGKVIMALFSIGLLISCQKHEIRSIQRDITVGSWKITHYYENGMNQTNHYSDYIFTFTDGGSVKAVNSSNICHGSWTLVKEGKELEFNLFLPVPLYELSDDWEVVDHSSKKLELKDVASDGSVNLLTFEKM